MKNNLKVDIVIPTFNGKELLSKHLPDVLKNTPELGKLIIVDDGSTDGTKEFLEEKYPSAVYIYGNKNNGFTKSVNLGAARATSEFFVSLNNDVSPQKGYISATLKHFSNPKVFAVSFNESQSSWPKVKWDNGKIGFTQGDDRSRPHLSAWASGGSAIFRRSTWNTLGGLNEIYSPGYWEDIDIGWRAWKSGSRIIWEPNSHVIHQHESSFKKKNQKYMSLIKQRNELLFHWQNISDEDLLASHFRFLFRYTIKHPGYLKVIFAALKQLPKFKRISSLNNVSDKQLITIVDHALEN